MNKVKLATLISRGYFLMAIVVSFLHLIHAARKGGLEWEAWLVPFMVDGIAVMGVLLRGEEFASRTRKIGFRTQCAAGFLSLLGNVYAAHNAGGVVMGFGVVTLFVFAEWLTDQIESAGDEIARDAATVVANAAAYLSTCNHRTTCASAAQCKSKTQAAKTRARNNRIKVQQAKALAALVNG